MAWSATRTGLSDRVKRAGLWRLNRRAMLVVAPLFCHVAIFGFAVAVAPFELRAHVATMVLDGPILRLSAIPFCLQLCASSESEKSDLSAA